jgi:outer membrane protein OmpA-like peptidoglycan-associated protein
MKTSTLYLGASGLVLSCLACGASAPTPELMTARNVYSQARSSEAVLLNPKGVHEAQKALAIAEAAHKDDAGSATERNYAYIATRKSELAIAQASEALAHKEQQRAAADYQAGLERNSQQTARENTQYAQQLNQTQQQLEQNSQELQQREQKLAELQAAAQKAEEQLKQLEAVREEEGRLIISLSGVLFETGGDRLSQNAESRLDKVAQALTAYPDRSIVVEGHTDATGSDASNQQLSQKRADAVRAYLQQRGVPAEQMRAIGRGESQPIASNDTAEGRANNRRVEVIIEPANGQRHSQTEPTPTSEGKSAQNMR